MIKYIEFCGDEWIEIDNILGDKYDLTENTIILCNNTKTKYKMVKLTINVLDRKFNTLYNAWVDEEDYDIFDKDRCFINFSSITIFNLYNQKITLSIEPSIIYKAKNVKDIHFVDVDCKNKYMVYAMTNFEDSEEIFNKGLDEVCKTIIGGRYGCYNGSWVKKTI